MSPAPRGRGLKLGVTPDGGDCPTDRRAGGHDD